MTRSRDKTARDPGVRWRKFLEFMRENIRTIEGRGLHERMRSRGNVQEMIRQLLPFILMDVERSGLPSEMAQAIAGAARQGQVKVLLRYVRDVTSIPDIQGDLPYTLSFLDALVCLSNLLALQSNTSFEEAMELLRYFAQMPQQAPAVVPVG